MHDIWLISYAGSIELLSAALLEWVYKENDRPVAHCILSVRYMQPIRIKSRYAIDNWLAHITVTSNSIYEELITIYL
jgi:hypothetical protein